MRREVILDYRSAPVQSRTLVIKGADDFSVRSYDFVKLSMVPNSAVMVWVVLQQKSLVHDLYQYLGGAVK
mgnify:CR=1 FL=1